MTIGSKCLNWTREKLCIHKKLKYDKKMYFRAWGSCCTLEALLLYNCWVKILSLPYVIQDLYGSANGTYVHREQSIIH